MRNMAGLAKPQNIKRFAVIFMVSLRLTGFPAFAANLRLGQQAGANGATYSLIKLAAIKTAIRLNGLVCKHIYGYNIRKTSCCQIRVWC